MSAPQGGFPGWLDGAAPLVVIHAAERFAENHNWYVEDGNGYEALGFSVVPRSDPEWDSQSQTIGVIGDGDNAKVIRYLISRGKDDGFIRQDAKIVFHCLDEIDNVDVYYNVPSKQPTRKEFITFYSSFVSYSPGDYGSAVRLLNQFLDDLGLFKGTKGETYTNRTSAAVKRWQAQLGIEETGIWDQVTDFFTKQFVSTFS